MGKAIDDMFLDGYGNDGGSQNLNDPEAGNTSNDVAGNADDNSMLLTNVTDESNDDLNEYERYNQNYDNDYLNKDVAQDSIDPENISIDSPTDTIDPDIERYLIPELSKPVVLTTETGDEVEVEITPEDIEKAAWSKHYKIQDQVDEVLSRTTHLITGYKNSQLAKWAIDQAANGMTDEQIFNELTRHIKAEEQKYKDLEEEQYLTPEQQKQKQLEQRLLETEAKLQKQEDKERQQIQAVQQQKQLEEVVNTNITMFKTKLQEQYNIDREELNPTETALVRKALQDLYARTDNEGRVLRDPKTKEVLFYGINDKRFTDQQIDGILNYAFNLLPKKIMAGRVKMNIDVNSIHNTPTQTQPKKNDASQMIKNANIPKVAGSNVSAGGKIANSEQRSILTNPNLTRQQKIDEIYKMLD